MGVLVGSPEDVVLVLPGDLEFEAAAGNLGEDEFKFVDIVVGVLHGRQHDDLVCEDGLLLQPHVHSLLRTHHDPYPVLLLHHLARSHLYVMQLLLWLVLGGRGQ